MNWFQAVGGLGGIAAFLTALAAVIGLLVKYRRDRDDDQRNEAIRTTEYAEADFGANLQLMERIDARVERLVESRMASYHAEQVQDRRRIDALTHIVRVLVGEWPPTHPRPTLPRDVTEVVPEALPPDWRN